jgi:hypothetical protein
MEFYKLLSELTDNELKKAERYAGKRGSNWDFGPYFQKERTVVKHIKLDNEIIKKQYDLLLSNNRTSLNNIKNAIFKEMSTIQNILTSPLKNGNKSFILPGTCDYVCSKVKVNKLVFGSEGKLALVSNDGKHSVWIKAIVNDQWSYIQYGFDNQGIAQIRTFSKGKSINLKIKKINKGFLMAWSKNEEISWHSCGTQIPKTSFQPTKISISTKNDGCLTSLKIISDHLAKGKIDTLPEHNKNIAKSLGTINTGAACGFLASPTRIFPNIHCNAKIQREITIRMCAGERQSCQLAILPFKKIAHISITIDIPKIEKYIELGHVVNVDISKYRYSKIIGSNLLPDPIINYKNQLNYEIQSLRPLKQTSLLLTFDLPEDIHPGEFPGEINLISDNGKKTKLPIKVNVYDFKISKHPDLVMPFSDTAAAPAAYTGYLKTTPHGNRFAFKIVDENAYMDMVEKISKDLVKHRITASRMSVCFIPPWFILKESNDGNIYYDTRFFDKTVKKMFSAGITFIMLDEFSTDKAKCPKKAKAFITSLSKTIRKNSWNDKIILKISDEPKKANIKDWIYLSTLAHQYGIPVTTTVNNKEVGNELLPYLDVLLTAGTTHALQLKRSIPKWTYYNHMTLESSLFGARQAVWLCHKNQINKYSYYAHNLWVFWNPGNPWSKMDSYVGLAETFRVYPPKKLPCYFNNYKGPKMPFDIISSLRWEATSDAVIDWLYIKKVESAIHLAKQNAFNELAFEGKNLLEALTSSICAFSENDLSYHILSKGRRRMAQYIIKVKKKVKTTK